MVCSRCKMAVKEELLRLGFHPVVVELGEAEITEKLSQTELEQVNAGMLKYGLELMEDKKCVLIQKIKNIIVELVHYSEEPLVVNLSEYLHVRLEHNYTYLASLFSQVQGTTIEKYFILQKIERVKELLVYNELSLTEIAYLMHYSSLAHLSAQFKKVTGLTPSHFKQLREKRRKMLEDL
jgi:AraC-like DNA-binding protein